MTFVSRWTLFTQPVAGLTAALLMLVPADAQTLNEAPKVEVKSIDKALVATAAADLPTLTTSGDNRPVFGRHNAVSTPSQSSKNANVRPSVASVAESQENDKASASRLGGRFSQAIGSWFSRDESDSNPPVSSPIAQAGYGGTGKKFFVQQAHRTTRTRQANGRQQLGTRSSHKPSGGLLGRWFNSQPAATNKSKETVAKSKGQSRRNQQRVASAKSKPGTRKASKKVAAKKTAPKQPSLVRIGPGSAKPLVKPAIKAPRPLDGVVMVSDAPTADTTPMSKPIAKKPRHTQSNGPVFVTDSSEPLPTLKKPSGEAAIAGAMAIASSSGKSTGKRVAPLPGDSVLFSKPAATQQPEKLASGPVRARRLPQKTQAVATTPKPASKPLKVATKPKSLQPATEPMVVAGKPSKRAVEILSKACQDAPNATSSDEYTQIVQQCRHVLAIDDAKVVVDYANELASWALNKRGELRADAGDNADAITDFDDAVRMDANRWRARHNRGVLLAQSNKYDEALEDFNSVIRLNPEFAKAYANRAALSVLSGDFEPALKDYRRAIALDPDLAVAHKGRGRVCHMLGRMEEALRHLDAATLLSPDDAHIACCRADLLVDNGRYSQAIAGYRQAIALDPAQTSAYRNLAWLFATCPEERFRNGTVAVELASKALELTNGEDDITLDTLAAAQAAAGDFEAAVSLMQRAIAAADSGANTEAYNDRLQKYEQGELFLSQPVTPIRQASYEK